MFTHTWNPLQQYCQTLAVNMKQQPNAAMNAFIAQKPECHLNT